MIRMSDVSMEYANGVRAVKKATLRIDEGEFVFLVGPSGSGKSTLIKMLTGEVKPTAGKIIVNNYNIGSIKKREIPYLRRTLGVVFQDFRLIEKKTVYENVAFAMRAVGAKNRAIRKRVPYVLELVGLTEKADTCPLELSGGEQQRVAIARALVNNPRLIIADEPTGNLDPARSYELMTLFEKINELGTTVLIVTHEKELVDEFEKRVIMIDSGEIVSDATGRYYADDEYYEEGVVLQPDEPEEEKNAPLSMLFERLNIKKSDDSVDDDQQQDSDKSYQENELNQDIQNDITKGINELETEAKAPESKQNPQDNNEIKTERLNMSEPSPMPGIDELTARLNLSVPSVSAKQEEPQRVKTDVGNVDASLEELIMQFEQRVGMQGNQADQPQETKITGEENE